jgi:signal transduction histidine kinase
VTNPLAGVRGRVTLTVFAVTACLYSVLGTIGFLQIATSGRDAIRERVGEVVDQLEAGPQAGDNTVSIVTPDGVTAVAVDPSAAPPSFAGELRVERSVTVGGATLLLVGTASQARLTESLHSLWRGLWIGIPFAALVTALMAGLATRRALRPVGAITELADSIGADDSEARVPVPDTGDEIEHLARTVNQMLGRIADGRLAQRRFSSDAAHELRTPLMALQGELELVHGHPERIDDRFVDRVDAQAQRLGERVDDLVLLSTLDEQRPLARRGLSLLELARSEVGGRPDHDGIDVDGEDITVVVDEALVQRAVRNLVANAVRHSRSVVGVTVVGDGGRAWLHVDDDGPGIDPGERDHVFRRFGRLDDARSADAGGAGLGLSIVASVATAHGGGVALGPSPLGGARVSIWLPVAQV